MSSTTFGFENFTPKNKVPLDFSFLVKSVAFVFSSFLEKNFSDGLFKNSFDSSENLTKVAGDNAAATFLFGSTGSITTKYCPLNSLLSPLYRPSKSINTWLGSQFEAAAISSLKVSYFIVRSSQR